LLNAKGPEFLRVTRWNSCVKPGAFPLVAREAVRALRASRIREVANTGMSNQPATNRVRLANCITHVGEVRSLKYQLLIKNRKSAQKYLLECTETSTKPTRNATSLATLTKGK
jgi:hypothetical protein